MQSLDAAIVLAFTGNGTLTSAFPGGIHGDRAPETTVFPYLIYTVISAPSQQVYGGTDRADVIVRFAAVGEGKTVVGALMTTFKGVFDNTILSLGTGQNCNVVRSGRCIPMLFSPIDAGGNEVWSWTTEYRYSIRN
jgi:hypothetical protein